MLVGLVSEHHLEFNFNMDSQAIEAGPDDLAKTQHRL